MNDNQEAMKELAGILGIKDWLMFVTTTEHTVYKKKRVTTDLKRVDRYSGEVQLRVGKSWRTIWPSAFAWDREEMSKKIDAELDSMYG